MIEKEDYCMDIIIQILAIQKSLSSFYKLILEYHLRAYLPEMMDWVNEQKQAKEIIELRGFYELHSRSSN